MTATLEKKIGSIADNVKNIKDSVSDVNHKLTYLLQAYREEQMSEKDTYQKYVTRYYE